MHFELNSIEIEINYINLFSPSCHSKRISGDITVFHRIEFNSHRLCSCHTRQKHIEELQTSVKSSICVKSHCSSKIVRLSKHYKPACTSSIDIYRPLHGTETALLRVSKDILMTLDQHKTAVLVLLH